MIGFTLSFMEYPDFTLIGLPCSSNGEESACNAEDQGSIPGLGRTSGGGYGNPLQNSCLENSMDRGAWRATVCGVTESDSTEGLTAFILLLRQHIYLTIFNSSTWLHMSFMLLFSCILIWNYISSWDIMLPCGIIFFLLWFFLEYFGHFVLVIINSQVPWV